MDKYNHKVSLASAFSSNFLGRSPDWYKLVILLFLVVNPIILLNFGPILTSWLIIIEFIFTLTMALQCYPLQPGGLIALEAVIIGLTSPDAIYTEVINNISVILLLIFMVAGIYFIKDLLLLCFTKIITKINNKTVLSVFFLLISAILSAFLDALTVTAVIISVFYGFYAIYHKVASGKSYEHSHDHNNDESLEGDHRNDLEIFRSFLRSLVMHGVIGTALGGVCTIVGEPQNLLIAHYTHWNFVEYFLAMYQITLPILFAGIIICISLEQFKLFGYGDKIPSNVYNILKTYTDHLKNQRSINQKAKLISQVVIVILLVLALGFHMAEIGLIGLALLVLLTSINGIIEEKQIGHAFEESLPFTALLVVFFVIIAIIHGQHLFQPIVDYVLKAELSNQPILFYIANGLLSMISDNVFVATIYITQIHETFTAGIIDVEQFNKIATAINIGTNIPSIATPNGQAAFLFLLTSTLAPLIRLSYIRMLIMALPYTMILSVLGGILVYIH